MPRASAANAAKTAQAILEAAASLFSSRGYASISIDEITTRAGVTRGAAYHHYGSKIGLFGAVAAQFQAEVAQMVARAAQAAGPDPDAQLRAGSHAFLDAITTGRAAQVLLVDAPSVMGWEQWRRLDAAEPGALLREGLESVSAGRDDLDAMTAHLSGAMNEASLWVVQHPEPSRARKQAHAALERLLTAVL